MSPSDAGLGVPEPYLSTSGLARPVFVLCMARSGSTLLRFVLDAHPELACPPDTQLPALCAHLAAVGNQFEGSDGSVAPATIAAIRAMSATVAGPYLERRGRRRLCDKSLGAAEHAALLATVFPDATFVCLYRHPMDVVASGLEATPWGLTGFGFDRYAVGSPGNAVLALARYWTDHAQAIRDVEESLPDRCHRIRYEDLVGAPQATADVLFDRLGVERLPDVRAASFAPEHERLGPADFKIWHTADIHSDSVGKGWRVPANLIQPAATGQLNNICEQLGYRGIDRAWGTTPRPPDWRLSVAQSSAQQPAPVPNRAPGGYPPACHLIAERLHAGLFRLDERFLERWQPHSASTFTVTADGGGNVDQSRTSWDVDLSTRSVLPRTGSAEASGAARRTWEVSGTADAWEQVLTGRLNLGLALRDRRLRYCHNASDAPGAATSRSAMLADLLGLTPRTSAA